MKVYLGQPASESAGGMYRVYASLYEFLPACGVEIVNSMHEADVIHAHIALYAPVPTDKPLVVSSHGLLWADHAWGKKSWHINKQNFSAYHAADVVTAPSTFVARAISRHTLIPTKVVRHGIDSSKWLPEKSPTGYVLWNKARVDPANDPTDMNKLAAAASTTPFLSTQGTPTANVTILGKVKPNEMQSIVANAGVYLDTPKESGGPCFGVLEAMSCGVPVLAWDEGGNAEAVIHKETGYLARPGDFDDLLEGMHYCFFNRERLGAAAREKVITEYGVLQSIESYAQAYSMAIAKHTYPTKVSIIVPCYNLGSFLPHCVESVRSQDFTNWEMLIIDDKSTDNSLNVAEKLAKEDGRIRVIANSHNKHTADTRNTGMWLSRGEYVLPLDADDRLAPGALGRMVQFLDANRDVQIVSGSLVLFHEADLQNGRLGSWPNDTDYEKQIAGYNRLPYMALYRRKVWENTGGYRRRIRSGVEDADFWTRALSFGYKPALLTGEPVLLYTVRDQGLHKKNTLGEKAWLPWFPWSYVPEITPGGALGSGPYNVWANDKPEVSIIIPVGPGHTHHLQACVDSIMAQDYPHWEVIIVNDTGKPWFDAHGKARTPFVLGLSFATIVDSIGKNRGVAWARNRGIEKAKGRFVVFLDADDIAQPHMLSALLYAHKIAEGGWIYGDWFAAEGNKIKHSTASDWDSDTFINKSLAPITGLYERAHALSVGGFEESAPGWEDWDFQLKLFERGICGTRVAVPLLTYNMHLGQRREDNFANKDNLLQYIKTKHKNLYANYTRGKDMACRSCGGKKTVSVDRATKGTTEDTLDDIVMMEYVGNIEGKRHFRSPNFKHVIYSVTNKKPFAVFRKDEAWFLRFEDFRVKQEIPAVTPPPALADIPALVSETPAKEPEMPEIAVKQGDLSELDLRPEVITALRSKFKSIMDVDQTDDSQLLEVRGIGVGRLETIRAAIDAWKQ